MNLENIDFNKLKNQLLPYFIQIYGEEFSDIIIERMNKIEPIFYSTIESKKERMFIVQTAKRIELTIKFLEHNNIDLSEEIKSKIIKDNSTYELTKIPEANNLLNACFGGHEYREITFNGIKEMSQEPVDKEYIINQNIIILKKLGILVNAENYNEWLLTDEAKLVFDKIEKLKEYIKILDIEFNDFDKQFDGLNHLINKGREIESSIHEKYMLEFLQSINEFTTDDDKKLLQQYLDSNNKDWYAFKRQVSILKIVGASFYDNGLLEAFGSKANEKMNDPKTLNFVKQSIIENRIKYYKLLGLYKNQMPFEEFSLTSEALSYAPQQQYIDDIMSKKDQYRKKAEEEFLEVTSSYNDNLETINSLGLVTNFNFGIDNIKNKMISINPNTRILNGEPESVAVLLFSPECCLPNYIDTSFIHEINHAVELSLINYSSGKAIYKCGFEFLSDEEDEKRDYEGFSEIVNQIIAMEISEAMHKDNLYLFDDPNTSKIKGGTSYEQQIIFVDTFWRKFRNDIIYARVNNNLESLFNVVGKENFDKLNDIINEYKTLPYYAMMEDVINKRTTELTEKRKDLVNQMIQTLNAMIEYSKDYQTIKM